MTLPTGSISMSQINSELGLSPTSSISFNQSGVRQIAGKSSGQISMNDLRGKSYYLQKDYMTVGSGSVTVPTVGTFTYWGYERLYGTAGSMSKETLDFYGGALLKRLAWSNNKLSLTVDGTLNNGGWYRLTIGNSVVYRTDASFSTYGNRSFWNWSISNIFSSIVGQTIPVIWE